MLNVKDIRALMVEFLGSFWIVIITCYSLSAYHAEKLSILGLALTNGLITTALIYAGIAKSGAHYNPVVTITKLLLRNTTLFKAISYLLVQLIASIFAGLIVILVIPFDASEKIINYPLPPREATFFQVFMIEFLLSFFYVLAYFGTVIDKKAPSNVFGFAIGGVYIIGYICAGHFSGSCINPIRNFGPSLLSGTIANTGVYWAGTIGGGVLAGFYYEFFLMSENEKELYASNDMMDKSKRVPTMD